MIGQAIISAFIAIFPAVFCTVGLTFLSVALISLPLANARRQIMQNSTRMLTQVTVEQEIARQYPKLYLFQQYIGIGMILSLITIFIVIFVLLMLFPINPFSLIYLI